VLAVVGSKVRYRTMGRGVFHCERCGGDRPYRQRSGRRWAHVLGIPLASLGDTGEHLRCTVCRTCYRVELLAVPTIEQMLVALLAATRAAVLAMLGAGGASSPAARLRGIQMIKAAGASDYTEAELTAGLAEHETATPSAAGPGEVGGRPGQIAGWPGQVAGWPPQVAGRTGEIDGPVVGLRPALEAFAIQLDIAARDWFLAKVVEVGLADGPLSAAERAVAGTVARHLGMSASRGEDVISLAEEAAQAG